MMEATTLLKPTADDFHAAHTAVAQALNYARSLGVVVTVERQPLAPLAMGNAVYTIETRPARLEVK